MVGVAVGGDDCVVWFGEIELEYALANASVCAGDQPKGWSHRVLDSKEGESRKSLCAC